MEPSKQPSSDRFRLIKTFFSDFFAPPPLGSGLIYWQERVLVAMLVTALLLGLLVLVPVATLAFSEGSWGLLALDVAFYLGGLFLLFYVFFYEIVRMHPFTQRVIRQSKHWRVLVCQSKYL